MAFQLDKSVKRQVAQLVKDDFEKRIERNFDNIKSQMIRELMNHPVTKEIQQGSASANSSGTLSGYGNLFTFIGFESGSSPIDAIKQEFDKTVLRFRTLTDDGPIWNIYLPAPEDIWDVTPMPWAEGRSWAKGIETGISGVGWYLYNQKKNYPQSRSGPAIQVKSKSSSKVRFKNVKYISDILNRYEKKFSQLDETTIPT
jgi:hypothetical protein